MSDPQEGPTNAVFLYMGILDAYEAVGEELIGPNVLREHVIPRMITYLKSFVPSVYNRLKQEHLEDDLVGFITDLKDRVYKNQDSRDASNISMIDVWELRAAIFGYENVFLDILGKNVIESYVFKRIADILTLYLPDVFRNPDLEVGEKLDRFAHYLTSNDFVKYANFKMNKGKIDYRVNYCAFARIHDSEVYLESEVRFCPWGMIANSIISSHFNQEIPIKTCTFTRRGTITELEVIE